MTEGQQVLYGGALWVGPLFLLAQVLLYLYLSNAPLTRRGQERARAQAAERAAQRAQARKKAAGEVPSHQDLP
jgi:hypothetical protein